VAENRMRANDFGDHRSARAIRRMGGPELVYSLAGGPGCARPMLAMAGPLKPFHATDRAHAKSNRRLRSLSRTGTMPQRGER